MGYILASGKAESVALHDCDILTYEKDLLTRLLYPVANPTFNYSFSKGFYARVADGKINGRVSRLLVTPLIKALKKTVGHCDYLEYMDSFLYPLAGEFSFKKDVLKDIRIPSDWGLEIGVLSEMYRNYSSNHVCQVDIAATYDHKHQDLSLGDTSGGLSKMSIDISKAFIRKLATEGETFTTEKFRTLKATYYRIALDYVETYRHDALMNGLKLDLHSEEKAVEMFAENILEAGHTFLEQPMETPFIPSWNRVISAMPDVLAQIKEAVEADQEEAELPERKEAVVIKEEVLVAKVGKTNGERFVEKPKPSAVSPQSQQLSERIARETIKRLVMSGNRPAAIDALKSYILLQYNNVDVNRNIDLIIRKLEKTKEIEVKNKEVVYNF